MMDAQIDQLAQVLYITIGVSIIMVLSVLAYIGYLVLRLHRLVIRRTQPPEVPRNGNGRPLRERR
jgi:hypothetical protein